MLMGMAVMSTPCSAAGLVVVPSKPTGFWAGTRLTLAADRAASGRLRVRVAGTVAVKKPASVVLAATGCGAGTDDISSFDWSPEHRPADRQAVPGWPIYQQSPEEVQLRLRGRRRVSYSETVGHGSLDGRGEGWTDCVALSLTRRSKDGRDFAPAFDGPASTLYVSVSLRDGRHVACGPVPAFCSRRRSARFVPPALPDFPPADGYPGAIGQGEPAPDSQTGISTYPYHVCPIDGGRYVLCTAQQAVAARGS
ncbi:MAG TPA: hypothetical protein VFG42_23875 [Baekduia sp.]|nr:hypothetical protein [Baekduia sp.]